jgi:hypothetical protein
LFELGGGLFTEEEILKSRLRFGKRVCGSGKALKKAAKSIGIKI